MVNPSSPTQGPTTLAGEGMGKAWAVWGGTRGVGYIQELEGA